MADTVRGDFPDVACSDCGEVGGVCFRHWGPLVPAGERGYFCGYCWSTRHEDAEQNRPPRPLGQAVITVEVGSYTDEGFDLGHSFRPEVVIQGISFLPDGRTYGWSTFSLMSKERANEIAVKVAKRLGVEPKLAE